MNIQNHRNVLLLWAADVLASKGAWILTCVEMTAKEHGKYVSSIIKYFDCVFADNALCSFIEISSDIVVFCEISMLFLNNVKSEGNVESRQAHPIGERRPMHIVCFVISWIRPLFFARRWQNRSCRKSNTSILIIDCGRGYIYFAGLEGIYHPAKMWVWVLETLSEEHSATLTEWMELANVPSTIYLADKCVVFLMP